MSIQIVIVDDHAVLRHSLAAAMASEPGIDIVGEAEDGREAVRLARKLAPDVMVMDIGMPKLNGIEATRQILADNEAVRIVALTRYRHITYVQQMLQAGAAGYALKSNPIDELIRAIRHAAAGKCYLSPDVAHLVVDVYRNGGNGRSSGRTGGNGKAGPQTIAALSNREREVLQLVAEGHPSKAIAASLCLSVKTVETHRQRLMNKLNIHSIADLTKFAVREGLTTLELTEQ